MEERIEGSMEGGLAGNKEGRKGKRAVEKRSQDVQHPTSSGRKPPTPRQCAASLMHLELW